MKPKNLEESFVQIQNLGKKNGSAKVKDLLQIFGGRGSLLLILFLVIPFCLPIQIPGFSTPFGLAIFFISLRTAFRKKIWLTQGILEHDIKQNNIKKISNWTLWFIKKLKPITKPRLFWVSNTEYLFQLHCIVIALMALILALPLPIPLSNLSAAWAIFFICLGLIKDDGLFIVFGYIIAIITILVFAYLFLFLRSQLIAYLSKTTV